MILRNQKRIFSLNLRHRISSKVNDTNSLSLLTINDSLKRDYTFDNFIRGDGNVCVCYQLYLADL